MSLPKNWDLMSDYDEVPSQQKIYKNRKNGKIVDITKVADGQYFITYPDKPTKEKFRKGNARKAAIKYMEKNIR